MNFFIQSVLILTFTTLNFELIVYASMTTSCMNKIPITKMTSPKDQPRPDQKSLLLIFDTTG